MYSVIAKHVEDNKVTGFRFLDMINSKTLDVSGVAVKDFMLNNKITNAKYVNNEMQLKWQDLLSLPTIHANGKVSTYLFKVLVDRVSDGDWKVANVMGTVVETHLANILALLDSTVHQAIVETDNRVTHFKMKLDGTFTSKQIAKEDIGFIDSRQFNGGELNYCEYEDEKCYYYRYKEGNKVMVLGSFSDMNVTYLKRYTNGYKLNTTKESKLNMPYNTEWVNRVTFINTYVYYGIDGFTFAGRQFRNYNELGMQEQYERMLALDPVNAEILKNGITVGNNNELLYCNLALCNIPDGVESVGPNTLSFNFEGHVDRIREANRNGMSDIIIPASVQKFSNVAFEKDSNFYYQTRKSLKHTTVVVENSGVAINVSNSIMETDMEVASLVTDGPVSVSHSMAVRQWNYLANMNFIASNFKIKKVTKTGLDRLFNVELADYAVKPYSNKTYKSMYKVVMLDTQKDFDEVYVSWESNLKVKYDKVKAMMAGVFHADYYWEQVKYNEILRAVQEIYFEYKKYSDMLMHSAIKEGDREKYRKMVESAYKRRENMYTIMNEKLLLVAHKYGYKHPGK